MDERGELVQRAKLAEQAERYDDMASCMKKVRARIITRNVAKNVLKTTCTELWILLLLP